jgi:hypothetical protein
MFHCVGDPWQRGISIWNRISTCNTSKVIATSGFGRPSWNPPRCSWYSVSVDVHLCWRMQSISVWDRTAIKYTTVVVPTSGLSTAMLDLMVIGNPSSFALYVLASPVPDSTMTAFEIYILSQIQPDIRELPFYCRHLEFPVERVVRQSRRKHHWKVWPRKH